MNPYPLVFRLEETMSKANFGRKGKDCNVTSRLRSFYSHTNSVLMASLSTPSGQKAVELFLDTSRKRGGNFNENQYFLRFSERKIVWVPATIVFYSPEHINAYLVQQLRNQESFEMFTKDYAVAYVDVFYPHLKTENQVEIEEIAEELAQNFFSSNGYDYTLESNFFEGRLGFLIVVESKGMTKTDYLNIMTTMPDLKEELNLRANKITLSYRKKLGLKDTGVSWKINEEFYHHIANSSRADETHLDCFDGDEELLSLTSKGLTLTVFATGIKFGDANKYLIKLTENNKKPKIIGMIDDSHELDVHLLKLKQLFHELFFDSLESFHLLIKHTISQSKSIEAWIREKFNNMLDVVSDAFDFELNGNKYCTGYEEKDRHSLIFLSNSSNLNDDNLLKKVYTLMDDVINM